MNLHICLIYAYNACPSAEAIQKAHFFNPLISLQSLGLSLVYCYYFSLSTVTLVMLICTSKTYEALFVTI